MRCGQCRHPSGSDHPDPLLAEQGFLHCPYMPAWRSVSPVREACGKFEPQAPMPKIEQKPDEVFDLAELF